MVAVVVVAAAAAAAAAAPLAASSEMKVLIDELSVLLDAYDATGQHRDKRNKVIRQAHPAQLASNFRAGALRPCWLQSRAQERGCAPPRAPGADLARRAAVLTRRPGS